MTISQKQRNAQREVQIAAYEAKQAVDVMHRIDEVMDVGGWRRDEVEGVARKMDEATARLRNALEIMRTNVPAVVS